MDLIPPDQLDVIKRTGQEEDRAAVEKRKSDERLRGEQQKREAAEARRQHAENMRNPEWLSEKFHEAHKKLLVRRNPTLEETREALTYAKALVETTSKEDGMSLAAAFAREVVNNPKNDSKTMNELNAHVDWRKRGGLAGTLGQHETNFGSQGNFYMIVDKTGQYIGCGYNAAGESKVGVQQINRVEYMLGKGIKTNTLGGATAMTFAESMKPSPIPGDAYKAALDVDSLAYAKYGLDYSVNRGNRAFDFSEDDIKKRVREVNPGFLVQKAIETGKPYTELEREAVEDMKRSGVGVVTYIQTALGDIAAGMNRATSKGPRYKTA